MKLFLTFLYCIFFVTSAISQNHSEFNSHVVLDDKSNFNISSYKSCVVDKNGLFWISTEMGLYNYDGNNFKKIINNTYPAISSDRIVEIGTDYLTGDVIFVTYPENSVYRIEDNIIKKISYLDNSNKYLFNEYNKCILPNNHSSNSIIDYFSKKNIKKSYDISHKSFIKVKENYIIALYHNLFIFNSKKEIKKIYFKNTKRLQLLYLNNKVILINYSLQKQKIYNCIIDKNFNLKLVPIITDKIFNTFLIKTSNLKSNMNTKKKILFDGLNYYLNFEGVIYKLMLKKNKIETEIILKNIDDHYYSITSSLKDDLFLSYNFPVNISTYFPKNFNVINFKDEEKNNCYSVAILKNKNWYSDSNWTRIYQNNSYKIKELKTNNIFKGFLLPLNNKFYYSGKNNFLYETQTNKRLDSYKTPYNSLQGFTFFNNKLWICDDERLIIFDGKNFKIDSFFANQKKHLDINKIYTYNGEILIGTSKGVYSYKPFTKISLIHGLENVYARYIKIINKNNFWVGCYGDGLFLVHNRIPYKVKEKKFDLSTVHAIEEDSMGNLWISTNNGLLNANKQTAFKNILSNKPIECYKFTIDDGLPTNEFNGGGTHPSLKEENGIIGFTSTKGFVWFDPRLVKKHPFDGKIFLNEVTDKDSELLETKGQYVVNPDSYILKIKIGYAYYFNYENLRIEYKFSDEKKWNAVVENSFSLLRTIPGKRNLLIKIHTRGFSSNKDVIKVVKFYFKPSFNETMWFWTIVILGMSILIFVAFQIGLKINKNRELLLKLKVDEKTLELKNMVSQLETSNEKVSKALKDRELLLKEIHHRVKNNLQLVISLLNIQGRRNNYLTIEEFLEKGQTRIIAMLLIHQNLYQNESIEKLDVQKYLENLVENILLSYGTSNTEIKILIETNDTFLKLQTAIPFGLIINEMVTNSLKYAFPNNHGNITIMLSEKTENEFEFIYTDNGIGFKKANLKKRTFGLELIELLVSQLEGTFKLQSDNGVRYEITFNESYV